MRFRYCSATCSTSVRRFEVERHHDARITVEEQGRALLDVDLAQLPASVRQFIVTVHVSIPEVMDPSPADNTQALALRLR